MSELTYDLISLFMLGQVEVCVPGLRYLKQCEKEGKTLEEAYKGITVGSWYKYIYDMVNDHYCIEKSYDDIEMLSAAMHFFWSFEEVMREKLTLEETQEDCLDRLSHLNTIYTDWSEKMQSLVEWDIVENALKEILL